MRSQRLSKQLSSSLLDKTFEVDSPYKTRQREAIMKNSAPFLGKNYFDKMVQTEQPAKCPILNTALTLEHIKGAKNISHPDGDDQRLHVELEDGTVSLVNYPEPASEAGKLLFRSGNQITRMSEKWARGGIAKELDELKWEVFTGEQIALAPLGIARLWEKDLLIRQTRLEIQQKLQNGHVLFVQKQPFFGIPSFCAYVFCPARGGRTPRGSYRISLEPRKNQNLPTVPLDAIRGSAIRGHGIHGAQWYCLTCLENIWNGVGLITTNKLAEIVVDADHRNDAHQPSRAASHGNRDSNSNSSRSGGHGIEGPRTRAQTRAKSWETNVNSPESVEPTSNEYSTEAAGAADQPRGSIVRKGENTLMGKLPQPPSLPILKRPYSSLSQTIYSFMLAETREHSDGYFTLPTPQHAALLKWKSTILRRTMGKVKRNVEFRKKTGSFFYDPEDEDGDTSHDPMYWLECGEGRGQLVGLVDPGGLVIELTTAECRGKELSEVFRIVDAKVEAEWAKSRYSPNPPRSTIVVARKSDNMERSPHPHPLPSQRRRRYTSCDSDSSGDISSSSSSEEEP